MKIYIACSLTHVPRGLFEEYTNFIHNLAKALYSAGHDVEYALVDSDPQLASKPEKNKARLCYLWDRKMVEASDLVIAEASFPSTGLGIELQLAENKDIPVIICYKDSGENRAPPASYENPDHSMNELQIGEGFVSLMALGLPSVFEVLKYSESNGGIACLVNSVNTILDKGK